MSWVLAVSAVVPAIAPSAAIAAKSGDSSPAVVQEGYLLGAGDKLKITVYNEPTLTGEYAITSEGNVSMPLVGDVSAKGISIKALQEALTSKLASYVKDPIVSVEPVTYRPYYILGEVNKPGEYPYSMGLKVEQAVAAAGGYTYRANRGTIFVRRSEGEKEQRFNVKEQRVPVLPGDTIRVGERFF
jgi:polysaccharide export outer membrane protein